MESLRQQKVSKLIQKELSELFQIEGLSFQKGTLITITNVKTTSDLSLARVYLSIFGITEKNTVLQHFKDNVKEIRFKLGQRVKQQLRIVPDITFYEDDTLDFIEKIDSLLKQ